MANNAFAWLQAYVEQQNVHYKKIEKKSWIFFFGSFSSNEFMPNYLTAFQKWLRDIMSSSRWAVYHNETFKTSFYYTLKPTWKYSGLNLEDMVYCKKNLMFMKTSTKGATINVSEISTKTHLNFILVLAFPSPWTNHGRLTFTRIQNELSAIQSISWNLIWKRLSLTN